MKTKIFTLFLVVMILSTLAACSSAKTYSEAEYNALLSENARLQAELDAVREALRQGAAPTDPSVSRLADYWPDTPVSDFDYIYNAELGGVEITRYKGTNSLKVRVPDEIEGQPVVSIGGSIIGNRFSVPFNKSNVKEVYLPNTVVRIGMESFMESGITSIVIPDSVTEIGRSVFGLCVGLESVSIGGGVTKIGGGWDGGGSFYGTPLYDNAPDGLFYVDNWLIGYKGEKPTGVISIKEGTVGIAESAFIECADMTSVSIPDSLKYLGEDSFYHCYALDEVSRARIIAVNPDSFID